MRTKIIIVRIGNKYGPEYETYLESKLTDYDPSVNNGNWQWNAGTGADPERFGGPRIFNPWIQSENIIW